MLTVFVPGVPAPQGSKRHLGRGVLVESSKAVGPWRERVALACHQERRGHDLLAGPVMVRLEFRMPRPKSTPKATPAAVKRPDLDKLVRAVLDAITGAVLVDDSQVVDLSASKRLAEPGESPGALIAVWPS